MIMFGTRVLQSKNDNLKENQNSLLCFKVINFFRETRESEKERHADDP